MSTKPSGLLDIRSGTDLTRPATPYQKLRQLEALIPLVFEELSIDSMTSHDFCGGIYRRQFVMQKDSIVVSKLHKEENWFLLFSGEISIYSGDGTTIRRKAPYMAKTPANTKRSVYAHEDSVMFTFHCNPDNETDMAKLESRYIMPEVKPTLPSWFADRARKLLENT